MNTTKAAPKKHRGLLISLSLLLIVALLGGGFFFYHHQQNNKAIAKQRAQYAQAAKQLNDLAVSIEREAGNTEKLQRLNLCGHTSSDFGTGILYCDLNIYLVYDGDMSKTTDELVSLTKPTGGVFGTFGVADADGHTTTKTFLLSGLKCYIDYINYSDVTNLSTFGYRGLYMAVKGRGVLVQLNCSAPHPKAPYFPITN